MKRPITFLKRGTPIVTHVTLGTTEGMIAGPANLAERRANARGTIAGIVAGHGGACYWVDHKALPSPHAPLAPYWFDELEVFVEPADLASDEEPVRTPRLPGRRDVHLALALALSAVLTAASVGCKVESPAGTHGLDTVSGRRTLGAAAPLASLVVIVAANAFKTRHRIVLGEETEAEGECGGPLRKRVGDPRATARRPRHETA